MIISERLSANSIYLYLDGEIDEHNAKEARRKADSLIEKYSTFEKVIFDLSNVSFMDSTGIGFLIGRYKKANSLGMEVYISSPNVAADKILEMSGLYSLIPKGV